LHFAFRSHLDDVVVGANELFNVPPQRVAAFLNDLDPSLIMKRPTIDRLFQYTEFATFIIRLFGFTGLLNWIEIQGAWTFVIFPTTSGGRYFTINIGRHEVVYSVLPRCPCEKPIHALVMDRLIYDFPDVAKWVALRDGEIRDDAYSSGLPRSVSIAFRGDFAEGLKFLKLDGVRRALIAYWAEALVGISERRSMSVFSRFHNWNAVAEIRARVTGALGRRELQNGPAG
jgi:hypothetical protein